MKNPSNSSLKKKRIESVLKSLASGASFLKACKAADIDQSTFWLWRQADEELNKQVLQVLDSRTQTVEDALFSTGVKGNVIAQIFWLKNRAKDRWKDKQEYEHSGVIGYKLLNVDISKYPKAKNAVSVSTKDDSSEKGD